MHTATTISGHSRGYRHREHPGSPDLLRPEKRRSRIGTENRSGSRHRAHPQNGERDGMIQASVTGPTGISPGPRRGGRQVEAPATAGRRPRRRRPPGSGGPPVSRLSCPGACSGRGHGFPDAIPAPYARARAKPHPDPR